MHQSEKIGTESGANVVGEVQIGGDGVAESCGTNGTGNTPTHPIDTFRSTHPSNTSSPSLT